MSLSSLSARSSSEVGRPNLEIDIGEPHFESDDSRKEEPTSEVAPPPALSFEKRLDSKYHWLIEGKPQNSKLLYLNWFIYSRLRMHVWARWMPPPREVLSYVKATEELKEQINQLTTWSNATGQASISAYKGGVGKTEISLMLSAGASIASGVSCLLVDVNLDGATVMSRISIDPESVGSTMDTPTLIRIYKEALEEVAMAELREQLPRPTAQEYEDMTNEQLDLYRTTERNLYKEILAKQETHDKVHLPTLRELQEQPNRPYKDPLSKMLVIADDYTDADFTSEEFEYAMRYAKRLSYLVVGDTPPGAHQTATKGINRQVTVKVRIGRFDQDISLKRVRSMRGDNEVDRSEKTRSAPGKASRIRLRGRPDTPLAIANATPKRHCNRRTQYRLAEYFGTAPDHVLLIPFIKDLDKKPIDIESYDARTQYHIYKMVLRVFEKLVEYNESVANE